jgi:putative endopeptidase
MLRHIYLGNEIVIPGGIFSLLDPVTDDAVRYARLILVTHELAHAFDPVGWRYDANGDLNNGSPSEDQKRYDERSQKMVEQFNGYEVDNLANVDGRLTVAENIADLGGLEIAYAAFEIAERRKPLSERNRTIGGLTPQQLFFVAYAQLHREKMTQEAGLQQRLRGPHSPGKYRVNGPLSNMPEFATAFGIRRGPMVRLPRERVRFWAKSKQNRNIRAVSAAAGERFHRTAVAVATGKDRSSVRRR